MAAKSRAGTAGGARPAAAEALRIDWVDWRWRRLGEFDPVELYRMLKLRQEVFVVEQNCVYLDLDGFDERTWHLTAHDDTTLAACLRLAPPGVVGPEAALGRVVVARRYRGHGLARAMMRTALDRLVERHGGGPVRLAAQQHLAPFYASLGFDPISAPYDEDGIPHVDMLIELG